ncbi:TPA: RNHCP domain-containing protein [Candidatus Uhrbacteria bacterium]|nr:RNHCP domain-containing protein [Candidatus Uhrbacteria bacterium]
MRKNFLSSGNDAFVCENCKLAVTPLTNGSYRNHCPRCLYCKHVDVVPGDRLATCQGLMEPVGVEYSPKKGWVILHRCTTCNELRRNKAALNDAEADDYELIIALASSP